MESYWADLSAAVGLADRGHFPADSKYGRHRGAPYFELGFHLGVAVVFAVELRVSWLGKHRLFKAPSRNSFAGWVASPWIGAPAMGRRGMRAGFRSGPGAHAGPGAGGHAQRREPVEDRLLSDRRQSRRSDHARGLRLPGTRGPADAFVPPERKPGAGICRSFRPCSTTCMAAGNAPQKR